MKAQYFKANSAIYGSFAKSPSMENTESVTIILILNF